MPRKQIRKSKIYSEFDDEPFHYPDSKESNDFAEQFTSDTICVSIGNSGKKYSLHKERLASASLYFERMFKTSLNTTEIAQNSIHLDTPADSKEGFAAFIEFIYRRKYSVDEEPDQQTRCVYHVKVYIQAERLVAEALKTLAFKGLEKEISSQTKLSNSWGFEENSVKQLIAPAVIELVRLIYDNTPGETAMETNGEPKTVFVQSGSDGWEQPIDREAGGRSKAYDKMRVLIARYAASNITSLRKSPEFWSLFTKLPDFMCDVVWAVGDGKAVQADST